MSVHHCPKCELAFTWQTELDDHCRSDHPAFRHDYPATAPPVEPAPAVPTHAPLERHHLTANVVDWLVPPQPRH